MDVSQLARAFFRELDKQIGPFDRPFQFRPFPFEAGGALNFLTVGAGRELLVTYVSWDLLGHEMQKVGALGRYELLAVCDNEKWCVEILTAIGRQSLQELFEEGDTLDIRDLVGKDQPIQGVIFEEALSIEFTQGAGTQRCGLLRCIGVTQSELNWARRNGTPSLIEQLKLASVYPATIMKRHSLDLT